MVTASTPQSISPELLSDAYLRVDVDWRIVDLNERACSLLGLTRSVLSRGILWDLLPEWIGGKSYYELHRSLTEQSEAVIEDYWPERNLWLEITVRPTGYQLGHGVDAPAAGPGICLFLRDTSELKRLQQTLQETQDRFRSTFEAAAVGIGHIAIDGRWLRVNERLCNILGYSPDELLLRAAHTITHPDDLSRELRALRMLLAGRVAQYSLEKRYIHKFGTPVWVEITVSLVEPASTGSRYLVAFVNEISERRVAEEQLRQQLVINRSITSSTTESLFTLDTSGRVTFINPAAEELIGWSAEEMLGEYLHSKIFHTRPGGAAYPYVESPMTTVLSTGVPVRNHEDYAVTKSGDVIPVLCSAAPIIDPSGMVMGTVVAIHDESELKKAQSQLKALYEREHNIAETLQRSLLMMPPSDAFDQLTVESLYTAAWEEAQVGGDFCDAFELDAGKVVLVMGDVAGKGLTAAARTAEIKYTLRMLMRETSDPSTALRRLNQVLANRPGDDTIVTLTIAVIAPSTGELCYSSAGSEPTLIVRNGGQVDATEHCGLPLGADWGAAYKMRETTIDLNETLVMFTDGITEARNKGLFFGIEGVTDLAAAGSNQQPLGTTASAIMEGARTFAGGRLQDDACIMLVRRLPPQVD